ncbi:hypothetical protein ARMSODRAFT_731455 [Armillaria solidipes]|uniref:Uncharacterized protein n=1 Tax=Armillaria solidipes TaxID=1076256 RepID=A0A2H3ARF6_9AGAR|nr:hypothetical protein ARMSODRAFT_731455 [Armillaria solidipes]
MRPSITRIFSVGSLSCLPSQFNRSHSAPRHLISQTIIQRMPVRTKGRVGGSRPLKPSLTIAYMRLFCDQNPHNSISLYHYLISKTTPIYTRPVKTRETLSRHPDPRSHRLLGSSFAKPVEVAFRVKRATRDKIFCNEIISDARLRKDILDTCLHCVSRGPMAGEKLLRL